MKMSITLREVQRCEDVIKLINSGEVVEGIEGFSFNAEEIAGQYAYEAQIESGFPVDPTSLMVQLGFLQREGAEFNLFKAVDHAINLNKHFGSLVVEA